MADGSSKQGKNLRASVASSWVKAYLRSPTCDPVETAEVLAQLDRRRPGEGWPRPGRSTGVNRTRPRSSRSAGSLASRDRGVLLRPPARRARRPRAGRRRIFRSAQAGARWLSRRHLELDVDARPRRGTRGSSTGSIWTSTWTSVGRDQRREAERPHAQWACLTASSLAQTSASTKRTRRRMRYAALRLGGVRPTLGCALARGQLRCYPLFRCAKTRSTGPAATKRWRDDAPSASSFSGLPRRRLCPTADHARGEHWSQQRASSGRVGWVSSSQRWAPPSASGTCGASRT